MDGAVALATTAKIANASAASVRIWPSKMSGSFDPPLQRRDKHSIGAAQEGYGRSDRPSVRQLTFRRTFGKTSSRIFAERPLQPDRPLGDLQDFQHLFERHRQPIRELLGVGWRPISGSICCDVRTTLLISSMMFGGTAISVSTSAKWCGRGRFIGPARRMPVSAICFPGGPAALRPAAASRCRVGGIRRGRGRAH